MTVTISSIDNDGNRTFTFSKTVPSAKLLDLGEKAAHYLFDVGYGNHGTAEAPRTWDDLSEGEKFQILDKYIATVLKDAAYSFHILDAIRQAREAAEASADFDMGVLPK